MQKHTHYRKDSLQTSHQIKISVYKVSQTDEKYIFKKQSSHENDVKCIEIWQQDRYAKENRLYLQRACNNKDQNQRHAIHIDYNW